jgi:FAD:protein FMN transferase
MNIEKKYPSIARKEFKSFGTNIDVPIIVENEDNEKRANEDLLEIHRKYQLIEKKFSRFDPESELSKFNKNIGKLMKSSNEMIEVSKRVLHYYKKTKGYFDPRIIIKLENNGYDRDFEMIDFSVVHRDNENFFSNSNRNLKKNLEISQGKIRFNAKMDFSGIVKGYATDVMSKFLLNQGWNNFLVDSGGDMYFHGLDEKGNIWHIDIEGISAKKILLKFSKRGIATSGITRRKWEKNKKKYHHLVNPKEPDFFSFELKSVTVIAKTTEEADVWAKTIFLMGKEQGLKYSQRQKIPCVMLDYRGNIFISSEIKKYLSK